MMPLWKSVPGYVGLYEVSSTGMVRSVARDIVTTTGKFIRSVESKIMSARLDRYGYLRLRLSSESKKRDITVHRLVMLAFVGECPAGMQVCHCDGDKTNNSLSNLRYDSISANHMDKHSHGTMPVGPDCAKTKLSGKQVIKIRKLYASGKQNVKELSEIFGISKHSVYQILNYSTWKHLSLDGDYVYPDKYDAAVGLAKRKQMLFCVGRDAYSVVECAELTGIPVSTIYYRLRTSTDPRHVLKEYYSTLVERDPGCCWYISDYKGKGK